MAVGADGGTRTPTVSRQNLNLVRLPISPHPLLNRRAFLRTHYNSSQILNRPSKARVSISSNFPGSKEKSRFPSRELPGSIRLSSSYPFRLYIAILSRQPTLMKRGIITGSVKWLLIKLPSIFLQSFNDRHSVRIDSHYGSDPLLPLAVFDRTPLSLGYIISFDAEIETNT